MKKVYAVIDTNVIVSAMLTSNFHSPTVRILDALLSKQIVPLFNEEIISEYAEVLTRKKFNFLQHLVSYYINAIKKIGEEADRVPSSELFPDPKDVVFYEVALSKNDAYLATGNLKHFPRKPIVVTPAEMMQILNNLDKQF